MMATTTMTDQRYGANSRAIRRSETSLAWRFSSAVGLSGVRNRPPRPVFMGVESMWTSLKVWVDRALAGRLMPLGRCRDGRRATVSTARSGEHAI